MVPVFFCLKIRDNSYYSHSVENNKFTLNADPARSYLVLFCLVNLATFRALHGSEC